MDVRVGLWRKLSAEELMLLNCGVGETLESLLDCKNIQAVHSKGDQSWVFFGRNDAKAETLVLWPLHTKSWLIGKDFDAGREEKGTTEDEMAGWHHWLDGRESEWAPGVGDGQGSLACCTSRGRKESDTTERLNWTDIADHWTTSFWTCKGPLTCGFFSIVNTRVLQDLWGFPGDSVIKNPPASTRDVGLIPGSRRSPGEGNGNPLQYSCLGNPRGAWQAAVHEVARVRHDWVAKQH